MDKIVRILLKLVPSTVIALLTSPIAFAQMQVTGGNVLPYTPQNLISNIFLGEGVEVTNITYNGVSSAVGYFSNANNVVGIDRGIVLTTGRVESTTGPFPDVGCDEVGMEQASVDNSSNANDNDLENLTTSTLNDVAVYSITFVPTSDTLRFRYCFGSEEYPEYSCTQYNDVFGFFIQGPGYPTPTNIAIIPGTNLPVTINNIHPPNPPNCSTGDNMQYFNSNLLSNVQPVYDGFTDVFTAQAIVVPCQQYTIKLAIADVSDGVWDSGVFLEAKSFGTGSLRIEATTVSGDGTVTEGCASGSIKFTIPSPALQDIPIDFNLWGTATNGTDYAPIPTTLVIPAGQQEISINVVGFEDNMAEIPEYIAIDVQRDPCNRDTIYMYIRDNTMKAPELISDSTVCEGSQPLILDATVPVPLPPPPVFSNTTDFSIAPTGTAVFSPINVFGVQPSKLADGVIRSVCMNITHAWDDDLDIFLISPSGQFIQLTTDNGQDGNNYSNTCFTPLAVNPIVPVGATYAPASATPFTGDWKPEGIWSDLWDGNYNTNGAWKLQLIDDSNGFVGTLNDWSITFEPLYEITYTWLPTTGVACPTCPITTIDATTSTTYAVFATDSYGCVMMDSVRIEVKELEANIDSSKNITCFGQTDGVASVELTASTGNVTYLWSDPAAQTTNIATGLSAGTYTCFINDDIGCTLTQTVIIEEPAELLTETVPVDIVCYNQPTGIVASMVAGGTAPYNYLWSNGAITATLNNVLANTYTVTVTDASGCIGTSSASVGQSPVFAAILDSSPTDCNGGANGSSIAQPTGGVPPYAYLWDDPSAQTTQTALNLSSGTYNVTVTDALGCTTIQNTQITEPDLLQSQAVVQQVKCFGAATGNITVQYSGGQLPYKYIWSTGETTANLINKIAGTYTVILTDANNCTHTDAYILTEPPVLGLWPTEVPVKCHGNSDGSLSVISTGGTGGHSYVWTGPNNLNKTGPEINNLFAGAYQVVGTDANGCTTTELINVTQPLAPLALNLPEIADTICFGATNGTARVEPNGGTLPYTYQWDANNQTTQTATDLALNFYAVTVTDANNCTQTATTFIQQKQAVFALATSIAPTCHDGSNGTAEVIRIYYGADSANVADFTYRWSTTPAQSSRIATGLTADQSYTVTATDAQGCTDEYTVLVENQFLLEPTIKDSAPVKCNGDSTGWAEVEAIGGNTPYQWFWNAGPNGQTGPRAENLAAGIYQVTVTDATGCTTRTFVEIKEPTKLLSTLTQIPVNCFGESSGKARALANGGVSPYQYIWWNGTVAPEIKDLSAGLVGLSITDANGCIKLDSINVIQPENPVSGVVEIREPKCHGGRDGQITIQGSGGTAPYRYGLDSKDWNGSNVQIGLTSGFYTPKLIDKNGCSLVLPPLEVGQPDPLSVDLGIDMTIELGQNTDLLAVTNGGRGDMAYTWTPASDSVWLSCLDCVNPSVINLLFQHEFTVAVKDSVGCIARDEIIIMLEKPRRVFVPTGFTPNGDQTNDILLTHGQKNTKVLNFRIYDRWGELVYEAKNFLLNDVSGWDGTFRGKPADPGVFVWLLEVEYMDGAQEVFRGNTTLIR